jgi:NAD+ diphosphatase
VPESDRQNLYPMAFTVNGLDRQANHRSDVPFVDSLRDAPSSHCLLFNGDKTFAPGGLPQPIVGDVPQHALFLGIDHENIAWFAAASPIEEELVDLRSLALSGTASHEMLGRLAQARALLHWHERHGFCANCGAATEMADAGYRRHCASCTADHFPRTDPVIIIAVKRQGKILLGRQAVWKEGMFSTLAGFMEPGETIEEAARREVFEESGIRVGEARILFNQPWPFPASLMIGLVGEALNDDIVVDPKELETARWFSRDDIAAMMAGNHAGGCHTPPPMAIAHRLIAAAMAEG